MKICQVFANETFKPKFVICICKNVFVQYVSDWKIQFHDFLEFTVRLSSRKKKNVSDFQLS